MTRKTLFVLAAGAVATLALGGTALAAGPVAGFGPAPSSTSSLAPPSTAPGAGEDAIDADRASEIALAAAGGGRVTEVERDWEHGRPVWDVEIVNGATEWDVDVDRETGTVVKSDRDAVDDDDNDDDNDDSHDRGGDDD